MNRLTALLARLDTIIKANFVILLLPALGLALILAGRGPTFLLGALAGMSVGYFIKRVWRACRPTST